MKVESRQIQRLKAGRAIKRVKTANTSGLQITSDIATRAFSEQLLQPLMPEADDHCRQCNIRRDTSSNDTLQITWGRPGLVLVCPALVVAGLLRLRRLRRRSLGALGFCFRFEYESVGWRSCGLSPGVAPLAPGGAVGPCRRRGARASLSGRAGRPLARSRGL